MSSHAGSGNRVPIDNVNQLVAHHARGERVRGDWKVGTEHEKFGYAWPSMTPLAYGSSPGIRAVLDGFAEEPDWVPQVDHGQVIALAGPRGSIALEPGGQIELSGQPFKTIHETKVELDEHVASLRRLSARLGIRWLWIGAQPLHDLDAIDWMPKQRYAVMRAYLPTRGGLARDMMQMTSTVQANLDYADERDMGEKLQTAMGISSIVTAMFANSPFRAGRVTGLKSFRASVWSDTDPDRQGLLPFVFDGALPTYERWAEWALDVPMFFIVRDDAYVPARGLPFREFWRSGLQGHRATMEDWELHLSTLFPDVRLKTYLEVRTADCVPPEYICALPALWKGTLYTNDSRAAAWDLVKRWSLDERWAHRTAVTVDALQAPVPGSKGKTVDLARELVAIAEAGLSAQAQAGGHADEGIHLAPLAALTRSGRSPADLLLERFAARKLPLPQFVASLATDGG